MNSADRMLGSLKLFTVENPVWTAEAVAAETGLSVSQIYRYFNSLAKAGLLDPALGSPGFMLGPAFIEYDRQIQACDPMLQAARPVMAALAKSGPATATLLLCRRYHERVMCVYQVVGQASQAPVSYERGRPMPMLQGASSKTILAHLPPRTVTRIYNQHAAEIAQLGLGGSLADFRAGLAQIRRLGYSVSVAEIDAGRIGLAAPILNDKGHALGSLAFAIPVDEADDKVLRRLASITIAAAREIEDAMPHVSDAMASTSTKPVR